MTTVPPEPQYREVLKVGRMKISRRNTVRMMMFFLYTILMVGKISADVVTENLNYTTEEFEGVSLSLSGRTERSQDEKIYVESRGKPNDHFDELHYRPYFDDKMETNVTYQLSKTAYLHCSIRQLGDKTVSWVRQEDLHILTIGTYTYTNDQRFTSIHVDNSDNWTLQIRDIRKTDEGIYECQVSTEPKMSFPVQLNIIVVESYISEGSILYIKSKSPVNLTCHVKDQVGTVFIFWYHNGRVLDEGEKKQRGIEVYTELGSTSSISRLFIAKARESDSGNYSCQPSYSEPANITLQVLNGEKPAAMQHGRNKAGFAAVHPLAIISLLSLALLM